MSERIKRPRDTSQPNAKRIKKEDACIGNLVNIRKYLGYFDTMHDFLDSKRLEMYLGNMKDAEKVIDKIESVFNLGFSCDIGNDENSIIKKVFGDKSPSDIPYSEAIQRDLKIITNNTKLTPPYYGEPYDRESAFNEKSIVVEYNQLPAIIRWIDSLLLDIKTNTYKQYILDYTKIPETAVCDLVATRPVSDKPLLKTIASEYDRNTSYKDKEDACIRSRDYVKDSLSIREKIQGLSDENKEYYLPLSEDILTKKNGELHEFESIKIGPVTGEDNFMEWTLNDTIRGTIQIANLISKDTTDKRKKNLNLFIHRMVEMMKSAPIQKKPARGKRIQTYKIMKSEYDQTITDIYELDSRVVTNKNTYIRCLTDFKKIGDLLLVKMARLNDAVFISNDRVTCVMAAIGYNVPTIRTSIIKGERDSESSKDPRVLTLYNFRNFNTSEDSKKFYLTSSITDYYNALQFYIQFPDYNYKDLRQRLIEKFKFIKTKVDELEILTSDELKETSVEDIIVADGLLNPYETIQTIIDSIIARFSKKSKIQMYELLIIEHQLAEINAIYKSYQLNADSKQIKTLQKLHLQLREFNREKQATRRDLSHLPSLTRRLIPFIDEITNETVVSRSRTRGTMQGFFNLSYTRCLAYIPLLEYFIMVLEFIEYITLHRANIQSLIVNISPFIANLKSHSLEDLENGLRMMETIFKENFTPLPGTLFNEKIVSDKIHSSMETFIKTIYELIEYNPLLNKPFVISQEIPLMNYPNQNLVHVMNKLNISLSDTPYSVSFDDYSYKFYVGILDGSRESLEELLQNIEELNNFVNSFKTKLNRTSSHGGKGTSSFEPRTPSRSSSKKSATKKHVMTSLKTQNKTSVKELIQQTNKLSFVSEPSTPSIQDLKYSEKIFMNLNTLERIIDELNLLSIEPVQFVDMFDIFNTYILYDISVAENEEEEMELITLYYQVHFIKQVYGQFLPILKMESRSITGSVIRSKSARTKIMS